MERKYIDVVIRKGMECKSYEYWCQECKQLRLAFGAFDTCGNCGSRRIVKGSINTLLKE